MDGDLDNGVEEEEEDLERWVHIQKEAFTNWCNDKLKNKSVHIKNIKYDFRYSLIRFLDEFQMSLIIIIIIKIWRDGFISRRRPSQTSAI